MLLALQDQGGSSSRSALVRIDGSIVDELPLLSRLHLHRPTIAGLLQRTPFVAYQRMTLLCNALKPLAQVRKPSLLGGFGIRAVPCYRSRS